MSEQGDYLIHSDPAREFAFELGKPFRLQDDFPGLGEAMQQTEIKPLFVDDRTGKRFAVAETGWPAEPVSAPYPNFIPATAETQRVYVERLLSEADRLEAAFVVWFFTRDYDGFWDSEIQFLPDAALLRLWKDCGLYAGNGGVRPGLTVWRGALARPRG